MVTSHSSTASSSSIAGSTYTQSAKTRESFPRALFSDDATWDDLTLPAPSKGKKDLKKYVSTFITGVPDGTYTLEVSADTQHLIEQADVMSDTASITVQISADRATVIP